MGISFGGGWEGGVDHKSLFFFSFVPFAVGRGSGGVEAVPTNKDQVPVLRMKTFSVKNQIFHINNVFLPQKTHSMNEKKAPAARALAKKRIKII